jgi:hypothetical protein
LYLKTIGQYLIKGTEKLPESKKNESLWEGWKREFNTLYTGLGNVLQTGGNALTLGLDAIGKATGLQDSGKITRDAI